MTCIVGMVDGDRVWIGGDACVSWGGLKAPTTDDSPKVQHCGDMLVGGCGTWRVLDIIFRGGGLSGGKSLAAQLRALMQGAGQLHNNDGAEYWHGELLVGYHGALYTVDSVFCVGELDVPFWAVGCGAEVALGAMYATSRRSPRSKILHALEASAELCEGVSPPFTVEHIDPPAPSRRRKKR